MRRFAVLIMLGTLLCCLQPAGGAAGTDLPQEISLIIPGPDKLKLEMRLIPAGVFIMGSPSNEPDREDDEGSQYKLEISKPFYMGIYEVTQAQWSALMGTSPSRFSGLPDNPVEQVSWDDCQGFITKLNSLGIGRFRLPTEVEWEYACRAGSRTTFYWGDDSTYDLLGDYAWHPNNAEGKTRPVGKKKPNAWGLYDIQGNVAEWCNDFYQAPFSPDRVVDYKGPESGRYRVYRGGCWNSAKRNFRSANRMWMDPATRSYMIGFRLVREAE